MRLRMRYLVLATVFSIGLLLAAIVTAAEATACDLHGRVVDGAPRPVAGALVTVAAGGETARTGADGTFCFPELAPGRLDLVVVAEGYSVGGGRVTLDGAEPRSVEITLAPAFGEELVVTTTGGERRLADSPIHVQTLSRGDLDAIGARTLADAVEWTPGLRVESNCQNCNTSQVRMLGLDGAYSQLLIDGQPTVSSLALVYGIEQLPARLIESIEVVKGGGSALYGAGAIAGVINLIPHDPSEPAVVVESRFDEIGGEPGYSLSAGVDGATAGRETAWTVYGQLDRVDAADLDGDDFSEVTRRRLEALGARAAHYPTDGTRLSIDLSRTYEDRRGGDLLAIDLPPDQSRLTEEIVSERLGASISWLHTVDGRFDYRVVASTSHTDRDSYYGADFDPNAYGTTTNPLLVADSQLNHYTGRGTVTWGAQYSRDEIDDRQPGYDRFLATTYTNRALFAQHDWKVGDRLSLLYGLRIDDHSVLPDPVVSPRAALLWSPRAELSIRASAARGFRPPVTFDEDLHIALVGGGDTQVVRNAPGLTEESSLNRALSFEWRPRIGRRGQALVEAHVFRTTIDDLFNSAETDDPATEEIEFTKTNFGRATVEGIELSGALRWGSAWSFEAGYVVQSARFADPEPDFGSRDFFRTPERYGTALVNWSAPIADFFLGLRYTGSMKAPHYAGYIAEDRLETTGSFVTVDLSMARDLPLSADRTRVLRVTAGARNLTDEYQPDLDRGPLRDSSYVYGPRLPRSLYLGVKLAF